MKEGKLTAVLLLIFGLLILAGAAMLGWFKMMGGLPR